MTNTESLKLPTSLLKALVFLELEIKDYLKIDVYQPEYHRLNAIKHSIQGLMENNK